MKYIIFIDIIRIIIKENIRFCLFVYLAGIVIVIGMVYNLKINFPSEDKIQGVINKFSINE